MKKLLLTLTLGIAFCYQGDLWYASKNPYQTNSDIQLMLLEKHSPECIKQTI